MLCPVHTIRKYGDDMAHEGSVTLIEAELIAPVRVGLSHSLALL